MRALGASDDPQVKSLLAERRTDESDPAAKKAIEEALGAIAARMARSEWIGRVLTGISLGSVLLLAALGLAITYGVMGVINMA
ncbi:MAG: urea ABC transporter permease subunit UrtB, partial [bacterium]